MDRTQSWAPGGMGHLLGNERNASRTTLMIGAAACAALLVGAAGYWLGRMGSGEAPTPSAGAAVPAQAVQLPTPPTGLAVAGASLPVAPYSVTNGAGSPIPAPRVTVRTRSMGGAPSGMGATSGGSSTVAPPTIIARALSAGPATSPFKAPSPAGHSPFVSAQVASLPSAQPVAAPAFLRGGPTMSPVVGRAMIVLRNDDSAPVDVTVAGRDTRVATLAPGASVPLPLDPGTYSLRAGGRGVAGASSQLAVAAGKSYTLVITRSKEEESESLLILEPTLDEDASGT